MMSILRSTAVSGLPVLIAGSFCCMSLASSEEPVFFKDSGQKLGDTMSFSVALGDLDGDGDLDAWVANDQANLVWINDGTGLFTDSGQALGKNRSLSVALGTLAPCDDCTAAAASSSEPRTVAPRPPLQTTKRSPVSAASSAAQSHVAASDTCDASPS